ncbi:hypothetical protein IC232_09905 [Microvirga sp. BT688]|uniref:hypothetical protein n=1 Tax=Microvirga sp. TaxID=1873136 RepID=UPI0016886640|nr:hypothetical protein [Microvirga sp.]MBD2747001.1 hypothetical protein [Microvirga sp.]
MAKAKDKKTPSKAKKSSGKSTGTKLAKSAKKSGIMDLINTDLGREILAEALIAAAAALTKTRTAKKAGAAVADAGSQTADLTQTAAGAVAGVVTEAARHFLPPSLMGDEGGSDKKAEPKKVKYVNRSSDHSKRKTTKAKSDTAAKR